ncbi:helix-turn-helix domain-containing protein [Persicobacter diffluens]|uniref:HTH araC/xylS-type domain-containing protein n=1 Tax=Persicobacter diffluens TaxID=981 RepID=A0AAN5AKL8_9BACT|nr:hypothetical protein PEDI_35470 [Persicobacter diffluens]
MTESLGAVISANDIFRATNSFFEVREWAGEEDDFLLTPDLKRNYHIIFLEACSQPIRMGNERPMVDCPLLIILGPHDAPDFSFPENASVNARILSYSKDLFSISMDLKHHQFFFQNESINAYYKLKEKEGKFIREILDNIQEQQLGGRKAVPHLDLFVAFFDPLFTFINKKAQQNRWEESSRMHVYYRAFLKVLDEHYKKWHLVTDYSRLLGIHEKQLSRSCRKVVDMSPLQVIHQKVLMEAKHLLIYSDLNVKQLAYELGFNEPSHFSKFFKTKMGIWPTEYRDHIRYTSGAEKAL